MKKTRVTPVIIKYISLITILISIGVVYSPDHSYACSCAKPGTPKEELENSDAVFSGKVVNIVDVNKNKFTKSSADPIAVIFEVDRSWKGIDKTQVVVYTKRDSASCGYNFNLNQKYLVYSQEFDGELKTNYCSRTTLLSEADKDIAELGTGVKPTVEASINVSSENSITFNLIWKILLVGGVIVSIVVIIRRMK